MMLTAILINGFNKQDLIQDGFLESLQRKELKLEEG
jgi:hypothetical protein